MSDSESDEFLSADEGDFGDDTKKTVIDEDEVDEIMDMLMNKNHDNDTCNAVKKTDLKLNDKVDSSLKTEFANPTDGSELKFVERKEEQPVQAKEEQPVERNEGQPVETKKEPVGTKEGQPVQTNEGQTVQTKEGQPVQTNEGQLVEREEGQPIERNEGQPVETKEGQPVETNEGPSVETKEGPPVEKDSQAKEETKSHEIETEKNAQEERTKEKEISEEGEKGEECLEDRIEQSNKEGGLHVQNTSELLSPVNHEFTNNIEMSLNAKEESGENIEDESLEKDTAYIVSDATTKDSEPSKKNDTDYTDITDNKLQENKEVEDSRHSLDDLDLDDDSDEEIEEMNQDKHNGPSNTSDTTRISVNQTNEPQQKEGNFVEPTPPNTESKIPHDSEENYDNPTDREINVKSDLNDKDHPEKEDELMETSTNEPGETIDKDVSRDQTTEAVDESNSKLDNELTKDLVESNIRESKGIDEEATNSTEKGELAKTENKSTENKEKTTEDKDKSIESNYKTSESKGKTTESDNKGTEEEEEEEGDQGDWGDWGNNEEELGNIEDNDLLGTKETTDPAKDVSKEVNQANEMGSKDDTKAKTKAKAKSKLKSAPTTKTTVKSTPTLSTTCSTVNAAKQTDNWGWDSWADDFIVQAAGKVTNLLETVEGQLGIPDPAKMAKAVSTEEADQEHTTSGKVEHSKKPEVRPPKQSSVEKPQTPPASGGSSWFGGFSTTLTGLVQNTGSELVTGGIGALEFIGKKTVDMLSEGDPGLRQTRDALAKKNKTNLSAMLREAKESTENSGTKRTPSSVSKNGSGIGDEVTFNDWFEKFQGNAHLDALEMLSNECENKLERILRLQSTEARLDTNDMLSGTRERYVIAENVEEDSGHHGNDFKKDLFAFTKQLKMKVTCSKLLNTWTKLKEKSSKKSDSKEVLNNTVSGLAELTSRCVELYRKVADMLLATDMQAKELAFERASTMRSIATTLIVEMNMLTNNLAHLVVDNGDALSQKVVTDIYLEGANCCSLVKDCHDLLLPILQCCIVK